MLVAFHAAVAAAPPAIVERAERACSRQTWFHPERPGHGAAQYGSTVVVVECERSEDNAFRVDRISVYIQGGEGLADADDLNAVEAHTCRPFRGTPCGVSAL